jgi:hypothetical protein
MLADLLVLARLWIALSLAVLSTGLGADLFGLSAVRTEPFVTGVGKACVLLIAGVDVEVQMVPTGPSFDFFDR